MKAPSIKCRLLFSITLLIITIMGLGSTALYLKIKKSYFQEIDANLMELANLLSDEIEQENGKIIHEWQSDSQENPYRRKHDLIQGWDTGTGATFRSPALGSFDFPRFHGKLNEYLFQNILLPNGHRGRALGVLLMPINIDEKNKTHHEELTPQKNVSPQILVTAIDIERSEQRLTKLRWFLLLSSLTLIAASVLIISWIIDLSLRPIQELSSEVKKALPETALKPFHIPAHLPRELSELVSHYHQLLTRIAHTRIRERDFSANAAHELRTPLTGISLTLEQTLLVVLAFSQPMKQEVLY